jgi:hypothetical protein
MTLNEYVNQIVIELKVRMEQSPTFPFDDGIRFAGKKPRPKSKPHAKNVALINNQITLVSPDIQVFELGNEEAEKTAPQYHILEDAKVIANPGRGTAKSRGSQAKITDKAKRDYSAQNVVSSSTKVSQEYRPSFKEGRRNYSNSQNLLEQKWLYGKPKDGAKFRYNTHYAYIERILEKEVPLIASNLNITLESYRGLNVSEPAISKTFGDIENNLLLGLFGGLGI